jgi:hypothetical protein
MANKTVTNFNRAAQDADLLTVADWRALGQKLGGASWEAAMRYTSARVGGAFAVKADGSLFVLTQVTGKRSRQRTYKPGTWQWEGVRCCGHTTPVRNCLTCEAHCPELRSAVSTGAPYVEPVLACGHRGNVFTCDVCVAWKAL